MVVGGLDHNSGAKIEAEGSNAGLATFSTASDSSREGYFEMFLKMANGGLYKAGVLATTVADEAVSDGFMATNIHSSSMSEGVQKDGNHGVSVFPTSLKAGDAPGAGKFRVNGAIQVWKNYVGTNTETDGMYIHNLTAAADGAQQYSPRFKLGGRGWSSDSALFHEVDFGMQVRPEQGTGAPTGNLVFSFGVDDDR
jgi:hypothetical protein